MSLLLWLLLGCGGGSIREAFVLVTKFDGYVNTEDILNMVMTKFDGYIIASATMFEAKKYDGYLAAEVIYNFAISKYDGYLEAEDIKNFAMMKYDGYYESSVAV